jgi:hypothetical protein
VGVKSAYRLLSRTQNANSAAPDGAGFIAPAAIRGIVSPWESGQLTEIAFAELFGFVGDLAVSRPMAMSIPAVARARQILITSIAGLPLRVYRGPDLVDPQPAWPSRTDGDVSPWHRMAWTLDDLIFYGWSLWAVKRGSDGFPISVDRMPIERWSIDNDGQVLVDGFVVDNESVILIPGPFEGLLVTGSRTLVGGARLERSWINKAENPVPIVELHETGPDELMDGEPEQIVADWLAARNDPMGTVAYTPNRIQVNTHGQNDPAMFIEARNSLRIDVGGILGIPSGLMDASLSTASLTYSTRDGQRNEFADFSVPYWTDPISGRLSMDDVVPQGSRTRFDLSDLYTTTPSPIGAIVND